MKRLLCFKSLISLFLTFIHKLLANKTIIAASAAAVVGVISGYPVSFFFPSTGKPKKNI